VKLQIYDTAGQERYRSIASSYLKNAHAVILVYDVHNKNTFDEMKRVWLGIVNDQLKAGGIVIVFSNKSDT
jgi:small GTP-binding protein